MEVIERRVSQLWSIYMKFYLFLLLLSLAFPWFGVFD